MSEDSPLRQTAASGATGGSASLLAAAGTWLRSRRRNHASLVAHLEKALGLSCLAVISGRAPLCSGQESVAPDPNSSTGVESDGKPCFQRFAETLLNAVPGKPPQGILVTSARPAEGKSTLSLRLALALAQRGTRVLLVEADLRRPTLQQALGLTAGHGLAAVLAGSTPWPSTIQRPAALTALHVLPCGPVPPQPAEMLRSPAMTAVLQACREIYDHIVIDTPPLLSVADALLLAPHADAVVLVARPGQTDPRSLSRACDLLTRAGARPTGYVLNRYPQ